jgi:cell fate (sporulation/competence/biofilm development) regulator YlbF (YheA/YmcA/DUF963 family)
MLILETKTAVIEKLEELCRTILEQESFARLQQDIRAFENDPEAQHLYNSLLDLQSKLQSKQQQGMTLQADEIAEFEGERDAMFSNPVAKGYVDAQEQLFDLKNTVKKYVAKTIQLGRVPEEADLKEGCGCGGGGCGCG